MPIVELRAISLSQLKPSQIRRKATWIEEGQKLPFFSSSQPTLRKALFTLFIPQWADVFSQKEIEFQEPFSIT